VNMTAQPVCESIGVQNPVDLTSQPCYSVGRSPGSDVQLFHATSSRRHALLFHHPNGSCYVIDCGSAHGTFVNGVRVPNCISAGTGKVVPHRIRRGALVRFGGPGAPSFVLKSFSVGFESFVDDLPGVTAQESSEDLASASSDDEDSLHGPPISLFPSLDEVAGKLESKDNTQRGLRRVVSKEGEDGVAMDASLEVSPSESEAALVKLNTRLNALGGAAQLPTSRRRLARRASSQLSRTIQRPLTVQPAPRLQKRQRAVSELEERDAKKARAEVASPSTEPRGTNHPSRLMLSPKPSLGPAIVSPVASKLLMSPAMQHVPPPPLLSHAPTPLQLQETLSLALKDEFTLKGLLIPSSRDLKGRHVERKAHRVRFSDDAPELFYPASVTPDELSADEGEDVPSFALCPTPPTTPRALPAAV